MDPCEHIRKKLSAYQDDEVPAAQKTAIKAHLRTCEDCRKSYEALLQTYQLLKRLPDIEAAESLPSKILKRVSRSRSSLWMRGTGPLLRWFPAPAAISALALAGILLGLLVGHVWIEQQVFSGRAVATISSNPALIIASEKAFDLAPAGSFTEAYLHLAAYSPEKKHAQ